MNDGQLCTLHDDVNNMLLLISHNLHLQCSSSPWSPSLSLAVTNFDGLSAVLVIDHRNLSTFRAVECRNLSAILDSNLRNWQNTFTTLWIMDHNVMLPASASWRCYSFNGRCGGQNNGCFLQFSIIDVSFSFSPYLPTLIDDGIFIFGKGSLSSQFRFRSIVALFYTIYTTFLSLHLKYV